MEKDKTIVAFLERVQQVPGFEWVEVVDYWKADLCAIGLSKGDRLVYICTYPYFDQEATLYDYDLEVVIGVDEWGVVGHIEGSNELELMAAVRMHLEV